MPLGAPPLRRNYLDNQVAGAAGNVYAADMIALTDALNDLLNQMYNVLNVRTYGAKGDGVTDDSAAFAACYAAAMSSPVATYSLDKRGRCKIVVPNGTYIIKGDAQMMSNTLTDNISGIWFEGGGTDTTCIVFQPSADGYSLMYNNDKVYHITWSNMSFYGDGTHAPASVFMKTVSNGHAQNYSFDRCNFNGAILKGFDLSGNNNNSEYHFDTCGIHTTMLGGAFLYAPTSGSDQYLNYNFIACNVEYIAGDFISMARGGNINVLGGSYIHAGDGSSDQCFFRLLGNNHAAGANRIHVQDIRTEHRHLRSKLLYSEWSRGSIEFESIDAECDAFILGTNQNTIKLCEFANCNSFPRIRFTGCLLMGQQYYHYNDNSYAGSRNNIVYDGCEFVDPQNQYTRAVDFFKFVSDDGTAKLSGIPVVYVQNSHATWNLDQKEVFDTVLNWQYANGMPVPAKWVGISPATGGLPGAGGNSQAFINLPINSIVLRIKCFKPAGGASTATNVTYTLTDATGATIAVATTAGAQWKSAWYYDNDGPGPITSCNSDNTRKLTLTSANIAETTTDTHFMVEYIG